MKYLKNTEETREGVRRILDLFGGNPENWTQGDFKSLTRPGCWCIDGALRQIFAGRATGLTTRGEHPEDWVKHPTVIYVWTWFHAMSIRASIRNLRELAVATWEWNDKRDRTFGEVQAELIKIIESEEVEIHWLPDLVGIEFGRRLKVEER